MSGLPNGRLLGNDSWFNVRLGFRFGLGFMIPLASCCLLVLRPAIDFKRDLGLQSETGQVTAS